MNTVILQLWEQSEENKDIIPVGCTLHVSLLTHGQYLDKYFSNLVDTIPNKYIRPISEPIEISISDMLYSVVLSNESVTLHQHELNNLIQLKDIQ